MQYNHCIESISSPIERETWRARRVYDADTDVHASAALVPETGDKVQVAQDRNADPWSGWAGVGRGSM
jgi:hypothetical protein